MPVIRIWIKTPVIYLASIEITVKSVRWMGQKMINLVSPSHPPNWTSRQCYLFAVILPKHVSKNMTVNFLKTKLFALPNFGSFLNRTSASLNIGKCLAIRKKLTRFRNWEWHLLRSRGTRERILILFAGARKPDFLDCNLAAPISFFRGFRTRFCVQWTQRRS